MSSVLPSDRAPTGALVVFALILTIATLGFGASTLRALARDVLTYSFQPAEARIDSYGLREVDGEKRYVLDYRYHVGPEQFRGERTLPTPGPLPRERSREDLERRFTRDAMIEVYVNPFDPSDAVVFPGLRGTTLHSLLRMVIVLVAAAGLWWGAWRSARGAGTGELTSGVWARSDPNGDWRLRVMRIGPWGRTMIVLALSAFVASFLVPSPGGAAYLVHAVIAWVVVLGAAAGTFAWTRRKRDLGGFDWRYAAGRGELLTPAGQRILRLDIAGLRLAKSTSMDSEGSKRHDVALQLVLESGAAVEIVARKSPEGFEGPLRLLRPVAAFLEARLGARVEELGAGSDGA